MRKGGLVLAAIGVWMRGKMIAVSENGTLSLVSRGLVFSVS
jgi:hypothetical protein